MINDKRCAVVVGVVGVWWVCGGCTVLGSSHTCHHHSCSCLIISCMMKYITPLLVANCILHIAYAQLYICKLDVRNLIFVISGSPVFGYS